MHLVTTRFSPERDRHIIVTYHYVDDPRADRKGIHPCSPANFERQILFLSNHFRMGSISDVHQAARNDVSEKVCAITFDDGLLGQYHNAVPILNKYHVPATFFIITATLGGMLPRTHAVHRLLSYDDGEELVDQTNIFLQKNFARRYGKQNIPKDTRLTDKRARRDPVATSNFKEAITRMPRDIAGAVLSFLLSRYDLSRADIIKELFVDPAAIVDLSRQGFRVSNHSHYHEAFDTLEKDEIFENVEQAKRILGDIIGFSSTEFCYPHGGSSKNSRIVLRELGITHAVTVEERGVLKGDDPLLLPRYDAASIHAYVEQKEL